MLAELNEVLDQLRHYCGTFRRISGFVPYHSFFFLGGAVMSLMPPILGLSGAVPSFFPVNLFIARIVIIAKIFPGLKFGREWEENESVHKDYPQKTILENLYCNHQYPLRISSQNIVFLPGELSGVSKNRYIFAPDQFHNPFLGIPENVRRHSVEYTRTDPKIQCL